MTAGAHGPARATTLAEVARAAGVSQATASKALNDRRDVGEKTRERVSAVAREMGFLPNVLAQSLMSGRTGSVGLLTTDLEGRFVTPIMIGAEDALGKGESVAIISNSRGRADLERRHLAALLGRRVDGIIVVGNATEARAPLTERTGVPIAYAYAPSTDPSDVSFVPDHRGAGRMATEHLLSLGRRRIAHIGGPADELAVGRTAAVMRAQGTLDALAARNMEPVFREPLHGDWLERWGWDAAGRLLDHETVDGIVCGNDQIARGAIDQVVARGLRVPDDVAVMGFDNSPAASLSRFPQSSIDLGLYELGQAAARAVLDRGSASPGVHVLPCRLVVRQSTGNLASAAPV